MQHLSTEQGSDTKEVLYDLELMKSLVVSKWD